MRACICITVFSVLASCATKTPSPSTECRSEDQKKYIALLTEKYASASADFISVATVLRDKRYQASSQDIMRKEASARLKANKERRDKIDAALIQFWTEHPACTPSNSELKEHLKSSDL